jgi:hypothetical protein
MNIQDELMSSSAPRAAGQRLLAGQALRVSPWPGELSVVDGRIWMTRRGDSEDYFLEPGQKLHFTGAEGAVIEADAPAASLHWEPSTQVPPRAPFFAAARVGTLRLLAGLAGGMALGLDAARLRLEALARDAASRAKRAQGCISMGDSMACAGALQ